MILERNYLDVYKVHTPVAVAVVVVVFCCRHAFIVVVVVRSMTVGRAVRSPPSTWASTSRRLSGSTKGGPVRLHSFIHHLFIIYLLIYWSGLIRLIRSLFRRSHGAERI